MDYYEQVEEGKRQVLVYAHAEAARLAPGYGVNLRVVGWGEEAGDAQGDFFPLFVEVDGRERRIPVDRDDLADYPGDEDFQPFLRAKVKSALAALAYRGRQRQLQARSIPGQIRRHLRTLEMIERVIAESDDLGRLQIVEEVLGRRARPAFRRMRDELLATQRMIEKYERMGRRDEFLGDMAADPSIGPGLQTLMAGMRDMERKLDEFAPKLREWGFTWPPDEE